VIAATGGTPVRVTSSPAFEEHPSWSARGDRLAYSSTENDLYSLWLASDLPDWTIAIESRSWSDVKQIYR
jgi:Tol biopolymer transport system component